MPRTKVTFDTVREIGLALPDVEDSTMYGKLALKVRGKLLACLAIHKSAEPGSLVVRIDLDQRAGLLTDAPETYYVTDHYRDYPAVLVRLSRIPLEQLRDLLGASWRFVTAGSEKKRKPARADQARTRRTRR
ncbi:MAG TPA: MmcQ/YjbR family DNA-binding protein [Bryobacteraceae bacterium]|nr:MmcQ/YjbR family DNA-binding protein [Bryobacteraceae bacterium]